MLAVSRQAVAAKAGQETPWVSINPLSAWVRNEQKESKEEYRWVACVDTNCTD